MKSLTAAIKVTLVVTVLLLLNCSGKPHVAEIFLQLGHSNWVTSVSFSPDGKFIVSGSLDSTVKLWDAATGSLIRTISGHSNNVTSVSFSPDGKFIVSGSRDDTVKLWDAATGSLIRTISGHSNTVTSVNFSPDGKFIVSGSEDNTVKLWDAATGSLIRTISGHSNTVTSVSFSPDGKFIVSGSDDKTAKLWDAATGSLIRTISGHSNNVTSVSFSPDGKFIVSGSRDNTVKLWDAATGSLIRTMSGHSIYVTSVSFSSDSKFIVSGSGDSTVKLWDAATGALIRTMSGHSIYVTSVSFSPDSKFIVSGGWDSTVKLWDAAKGSLIRTMSRHSNSVTSVSFSPNSKFIVSGSEDDTVKLWDAATGSLIRTISGHSNTVTSVSFSPNSKFIVSGSEDDTVKLWDAATGSLIRTMSGHSNNVNSVSFSPDSKFIVSGSGDYTVKLWDAATGSLIRNISGHSNWVTSVSFSPDGKFIVSGSRDNTVKLWDAATGSLIRTISGHSNWVTSVSFSPDGKFIVSGSRDNTVKLWDAATGSLIRTISGHSNWVTSVSFSPDGKFIVSGSGDNTVKLWDAATGSLIRNISGHSNTVTSVSFSPDGKFIVSGSEGTQRIWSTETGKQVSITAYLPGNEWITFNEKKLVYNSSLQGDEYMAVRFDNKLLPIYPLKYYGKTLKRNEKLMSEFDAIQPVIEPMPIKLWLDTSENKRRWAGGGSVFLITTFVIMYLLFVRRTDPIVVAREFFKKAGFTKITNIKKELYILHKQGAQIPVLASLWKDGKITGCTHISAAIKDSVKSKIYLIYKEEKHNVNEGVKKLRTSYGTAMDIIPLYSPILEESLQGAKCADDLQRLENPYTTRTDPYLDKVAITDPVWFYGRAENIQNILRVISQGQHVCICGLRKVGKTSLTNQLIQQLVKTPTAFIYCTPTDSAQWLFEQILTKLYNKLKANNIKHLPKIPSIINKDTFQRLFLHYVEIWRKAKQAERVIIFFDEIDKLFTDRRVKDNEKSLAEYVNLFSVLRGLAQTHNCLTTVTTSYRPDVNRHNKLIETIHENPMYNSFQEEFLSFFNLNDTVTMIKEIGLWKDIYWDDGAAEKIFEYTGGDPFISRVFASYATDKGEIKKVSINRVEETAGMILKTFSENEVGGHYKESVLDEMRDDEKELIRLINAAGMEGYPEAGNQKELFDAMANMKRYTLVESIEGRVFFRAKFFREWIKWRS
ncbi:MAG: AAA family ATPase [Nitrospirae bacterium YQR-1]